MAGREASLFAIRRAELRDAAELAVLRHALWRDSSVAEHERELAEWLAGNTPGGLPSVVLLAQVAGEIVAFLEAGLRSHADNCDPSHAVGYVEGWYVKPDRRGTGIGSRLLAEEEDWARSRGCKEMASRHAASKSRFPTRA